MSPRILFEPPDSAICECAILSDSHRVAPRRGAERAEAPRWHAAPTAPLEMSREAPPTFVRVTMWDVKLSVTLKSGSSGRMVDFELKEEEKKATVRCILRSYILEKGMRMNKRESKAEINNYF